MSSTRLRLQAVQDTPLSGTCEESGRLQLLLTAEVLEPRQACKVSVLALQSAVDAE